MQAAELLQSKGGRYLWHVLESALPNQDPFTWTGGESQISSVDQAAEDIDSALKESRRVSSKLFPPLAKSVSTANTATIQDDISLQAWLFLNSPYRYHWYCAGVGTGKSYVLARWALSRVLTNWETTGLMAANTHTQLAQSTLPHFYELLDEAGLEYVVNSKPPKAWKASSKFKGGYKNTISIKVGIGKVAHVLTRTMAGWKRIRGVNLGWFGLDEIADTASDAFQEMKRRLRCKLSKALQGRVVGIPDLPGDNWTYHEFFPEDEEAQQYYRVTFQSSTEAKHLDWDDYLKPLLRTIDPIKAMQEVFARIVIDQTGRVYRCYKDGINNVKKNKYDPWAPLYLTSDFNIISGSPLEACAVQLFDNGQGDWDVQVLEEFSIPNGDTSDLCNEFLERECDGQVFGKHRGEVHFYGDASGGHSQTVSEYQIAKDILGRRFKNRLNIPDITSNPLVIERVNAVNFLLRPTIGPPRLYIDPKCKRMVQDMRKVVPDKKGKEGAIDKSDKLLTHISDALGYLLRWLFPPFDSGSTRKAIKANYA